MIDAGEVFAEVDEGSGMVRFLEDPEQYQSPEMVARLDAQIAKSTQLGARLQDVHHAVACDKAYITRTSKGTA